MMKDNKWLASAGFVYVAAWVIGLLLEFDTPGATASNADLTSYFLAHQQVHMIQAYLIDGLAGIAILVFAVMLKNYFGKAGRDFVPPSDIVLGAGIAAASVSLVQAGMQQVLANPAILSTGDSPLRMMLVLINVTDTFKLLALALFSGVASILAFQTHALPRWLGWLGVTLTLTLVLGGLSFMIPSSLLTTVLFVSLPLLLFWVAAISVTSLRDARTKSLSLQSVQDIQ
jgi:hypothetical protein